VDEGGNGVDSITALEVKCARELRIPVIALLANDTWPGNLWDDDEAGRHYVRKFRQDINTCAQFFDYEKPLADESKGLADFRSLLRQSLLQHREALPSESPKAAHAISPDQLESARAILTSGRCIPFVGHGVYGDGPLSTRSIVEALGDIREPSLASVAEYQERFLRGRENFLARMEEIVADQTSRAVVPPVYELLASIRPQLLVSATCDLVLERLLAERLKLDVWIVCHILRTRSGTDSGKVLVFKGPDDRNPRIFAADELDVRPAKDTCVVYKPLGSPILNGQLEPEPGIDSVVATEGDHLILLSRLEHQKTGVPTAFCRHMQRYPLVFLGYTLDVWHHRLVLCVLESVGQPGQPPAGLAVREPTSALEGVAWRRLGVDLLPMALEAFMGQIGGALAGQT
jgi:hypothetical protein